MDKTFKVLFGVVLALIGLNAYLMLTPNSVKRIQKLGVIVRLTKDGQTFCTGTVVDDHMIITAKHCADAMVAVKISPDLHMLSLVRETIFIRAEDNIDRNTPAFFITSYPQFDTAVLGGDFRAFNHIKAVTDPGASIALKVPGYHFTSCGYPMGGKLFCTQLEFVKNQDFSWLMKGTIIPGMSGGPVMYKGELAAVNSRVDGEFGAVNPLYNDVTP